MATPLTLEKTKDWVPKKRAMLDIGLAYSTLTGRPVPPQRCEQLSLLPLDWLKEGAQRLGCAPANPSNLEDQPDWIIGSIVYEYRDTIPEEDWFAFDTYY